MQRQQRVSVHEAAIRLSVAETTILAWAQDGTLPAQMIDGSYWFDPDDIAAYANAHPDPDPAGDGEINTLVRPPNDSPLPR